MSFHYAPSMSGVLPTSLLTPPLRPSAARTFTRSRAMPTVDAHQIGTGTFIAPSPLKAPRSMWMIELDQAAMRVRALQPGWDGPRSGVVAESVIRRAVALASEALCGLAEPAAPYLMPAGDGSLQIEWDRKHAKLEFCLEPDGSLDFWSRDLRTGAEREADGAAALALFRRWAPWAAQRPADAAYPVAQSAADAADAVAQEDMVLFELAA